MQYLLVLTFSIVFFFCACTHTVTFDEGNFKITFPGKPKTEKFEMKMAAGITDVHTFSYQSNDGIKHYQVAYNYMVGNEAIVPDTLFQNLITGAALRLKPLSVQKESMKIEGHPAARYKLMGIDAAAIYDIYLVDRDVYQVVMIDYTPKVPTDAEIKAFMGSFKLLGK